MNNDILKISGALIERLRGDFPTHGKREKMTEEAKDLRRKLKALYNAGIEIPDVDKLVSSVQRSRSAIRKLVHANAGRWKDRLGNPIPAKFLTLTFQENIQNLKEANRFFSKFVQRINYMFRDILVEPLQYLCVPEFQKRGAIHYHVILFNFPFVDRVFSKIRTQWKDRFELKTIGQDQGIDRTTAYMSKYISKQQTDGRLYGQKRFFRSRGLHKTIIVRDEMANHMICSTLEPFLKTRKRIDIPFVEKAFYEMYYLGDGRSLNPLFLDPYAINQLELAQQKP
jgi:hypothetical protein